MRILHDFSVIENVELLRNKTIYQNILYFSSNSYHKALLYSTNFFIIVRGAFYIVIRNSETYVLS